MPSLGHPGRAFSHFSLPHRSLRYYVMYNNNIV